MKTVVIIFDLILLALASYLVITEFNDMELLGVFVIFSIMIILILNIYLLIKSKPNKHVTGWIRLYIKRKALEEKKKIDELSSK